MMLLVALRIDMSTPSYPQRTGKKPLRAKNCCLAQHFAMPLIVYMHLIKTLCQNICRKRTQKRKEKHMIKIFNGIITEEKTWKKNIPPKSVVSGYRRKSVEDCKPIKFKPHNSLRTPYRFEPHADSKSLSSIENLQLI